MERPEEESDGDKKETRLEQTEKVEPTQPPAKEEAVMVFKRRAFEIDSFFRVSVVGDAYTGKTSIIS